MFYIMLHYNMTTICVIHIQMVIVCRVVEHFDNVLHTNEQQSDDHQNSNLGRWCRNSSQLIDQLFVIEIFEEVSGETQRRTQGQSSW